MSSRIDGGRPGRSSSVSPASRLRVNRAPPPGHRMLTETRRSAATWALLSFRPRTPARSCAAAPAPASSSPAAPTGSAAPAPRPSAPGGLRPARARAVSQPGHPRLREPLTPFPRRVRGKAQPGGHPGVPPGPRLRAGQHDPRPLSQARLPRSQQPPELRTVLIRQRQGRDWKRHKDIVQTYVDNLRCTTLGDDVDGVVGGSDNMIRITRIRTPASGCFFPPEQSRALDAIAPFNLLGHAGEITGHYHVVDGAA